MLQTFLQSHHIIDVFNVWVILTSRQQHLQNFIPVLRNLSQNYTEVLLDMFRGIPHSKESKFAEFRASTDNIHPTTALLLLHTNLMRKNLSKRLQWSCWGYFTRLWEPALRCGFGTTISFIIFWDFSIFYEIFLSPQVKRWAIMQEM